MPYIPHTPADISAMLDAIGIEDTNQLFDEIPDNLINEDLSSIPEGINELQLNQLVAKLSENVNRDLNFIGAGSYSHHIPAAVWDIAARGEFYTAYTPYQAEASQGTLQLLYEFQTMMAELTGMEVSNASLYDGASALAEAVLMAVRANRKSKSKKILIPGSLHPFYRETVSSIVNNQNIELIELGFCQHKGITLLESLNAFSDEDITAIVIAQPNFFGCLEEVDAITDWAHQRNTLVIGCVNPIALGLIQSPGEWGESGADIVCGEGQPLGAPMASGGPYFGFLTCKMAHVRQMPGRIIGRTEDSDGKPGFSLTLQAREQHIRRAKATSNICTNQGLLVTAATIHLSLLGPQGLVNVAKACHHNTVTLCQQLSKIDGISQAFVSPYFHEVVLKLEQPVEQVLTELREQGIEGGLNLGNYYSNMDNCLLVCATETKTTQDLDSYVQAMTQVLSKKTVHEEELCS